MADLPATPSPTPGFPSNPVIPKFEGFDGLNTKPLRPGIEDTQMYWCDGWMPLGKKNLRTLYDVGDALFTAAGALTILNMGFGNAGHSHEDAHTPDPICVVVLSDGSIIEVDVDTGTEVTIAAAGTITASDVGYGQFGNQFIILVADQTDGYFLWDSTTFYFSGSIAPTVTVTNVGSGYTSVPTVTASGGSGSGSSFTAVVEDQEVVRIDIDDAGTGYVAGDAPTLAVTGGGGSGATATITIMPFGVKGNAVETYQGHVWVIDGDDVTFSAPGSVSNFASADGGGTFSSTDSFLRRAYIAAKNTNGFLYLIGDSSINYVSNVQTSGSPATTTFNNLNVDPQIGTPYRDSVQVFNRNIVLANSLGVHVSYGGAVVKVSNELDGIWNTVASFGGLSLSSAIANIFSIQVYMVLVPIIDPFTGNQVNKLCMWDGKKWWTSEQGVTLTKIASQEIDSVLTAWGTNGTSIYPLFQTASTNFRKVVQSKLFDNPSYIFSKNVLQVQGILNYFTNTSTGITVTVDNEGGSASAFIASTSRGQIAWTNDTGATISWTNDASDPIVWFGPGLSVFMNNVGQHGRLLGLTFDTFLDDVALVSAAMIDSNFQTTG